MFRRRAPEPKLPPEWLIVGLGNPGPEYLGSRHNVGFEVIDRLAARHRVKLSERRHKAVFGAGEVEGVPVALVKPLTFMNLSGQAVLPIMRQYSLQPARVLVVADDLDLPLGRIRIRPEGSAGGHNGHKSLIQSLGTSEYPRLKIGIGRGEESVDHVLSKFHPDERGEVADTLRRCEDAVASVLVDGVTAAMNKFNG